MTKIFSEPLRLLTVLRIVSGRIGASFFLIIVISLLAGCRSVLQPAPLNPHFVVDPPPPAAAGGLESLLAAEPEVRDPVELARRYKGARPAERVDHPQIAVGETIPFWYKEQENDENRRTNARLVYRSDRLNLWVEETTPVSQEVVSRTARLLEEEIFPTTRALFGREVRPGIDGDERLNILHIGDMGGNTIGYFSTTDAYHPAVNEYSNARDMFYINLTFARLDSDAYFEVVAHEFQHMIHWHLDRNETTWLNEGLSELSAAVNGYGDSDHLAAFLAEPDTPLTYFDYEGGDYGAAYLFAAYLYERFGPDFIRDLVAEPANGRASVEQILAARQTGLSFEELFADWVIANLAASRGWTVEGEEAYAAVTFPDQAAATILRAGARREEGVSQFGTDYWEIRGRTPQTVVFTGTRQIPLLDARPYSGDFMWTTVPDDNSHMHLTREVDLGGLAAATLSFQTWYDIELGWDYAYVSVSLDEGESWQTLQTIATSAADPHGYNLGQGYTGTSGGRAEPRWIEQTADLTPFVAAGQVWLRFEYVTDDAKHGQGFALDDIRIPEIGLFEGGESPDTGWEAVGFVRHANILPQRFLVQQILVGPDGRLTISELPLNDENQGRWTIPLGEDAERAIIAVSAVTPVTFLPAGYMIARVAE